MMKKLHCESVDRLFQTILNLETIEECYDYFEDLCTVPEMKAMAQRAAVTKLLSEKTVYNSIVEKTGASTATISRVNRSLAYGCGGYDIVFNKK